jgi:hypothetical protein
MRDYSKVAPQFWTGCTGRRIRELGDDALIVANYLLTCPSANMIGLYYLPLPTLCHETGRTLEGASKALGSLETIGFAAFEGENELVFVREMARFQIADRLNPRDKRVIGIAKDLLPFKKSKFFKEFCDRYHEDFHLGLPAVQAILGSPFKGPSKAPRSQEQEQEQEQEIPLKPPRGGGLLAIVPRPRPKGRRTRQAPDVYPDEFEAIWGPYPKVRGTKQEAFVAWTKLEPQPTTESVLAALDAWSRSVDWTSDGGKYIPAMSVWLRRGAHETHPRPANGNHARIDPQSAAIAARLEARGKPPQ